MGAVSSLSINGLQKILYEFNQSHPNLNKIGEMTGEGRWNYYVNSICHQTQPRLTELIQKVNQTFAELERKGVKFFDSSIQEEEFIEKAQRYRASRQVYLDTVEAISLQIEDLQNVCPKLKEAYHELKCREIGLRYSLGEDHGGLDALENPDPEWLNKITALAQNWKKKQKFDSEKDLDELQNEQLEELAKYPDWLAIVVENPDYLKEIFNWSLHNYLPVEIAVKNYETRRKMKVALLPANWGYARNIFLTKPEDDVFAYKTIPTKVAHVSKRVLTAAIYHGSFTEFESDQQERINILKPTATVHFKQGNYILTVDELLKELGQKNQREANITLCADWGFVNFHPVKGVWNNNHQQYEISPMKEENWTDHVPPSRIASHEELFEQYGDEVDERDFFFKVMSTRQYEDLNALDCHAYLQIFKRMDDGNWRVINIGLYAYRFQQGLLDGLWLFCATVWRVVCLLDQNCYYTHRQRGGIAIFCSDDAKDELLKRIFNMIQTTAVFQFSGRNCAYAIQNIIEDMLDQKILEEEPLNFFRTPITMGRTGVGPLDHLLAWTHTQCEWVQWLVLSILHTCFLSHRSLSIEEEVFSTREYFAKNGYEIYNPSYLPWQIDQALKTGEGPFAKGELYWGHTPEKSYQKEALLAKLQEEESIREGIYAAS